MQRAALVALLQQARPPLNELNADLLGGALPRELLDRELKEQDGQLVLGADDSDAAVQRAVSDVSAWERDGHRLVTVLDTTYPRNLHLVHDRPPVLFVDGTLSPRDDRAIAVVGTRHPTARGRADAQLIADRLGQHGYTLVSGLARGIDTAVHRTALDRDHRTVAVIGTGLSRTYPPENLDLQEQIGQAGAVVSCFWPADPPRPEAFRRRNAVMSGLALATVIVEAGERSGTRVAARRALEHGRPVLLWQGLEQQSWAREMSRWPGVYLVSHADEIVEIVEHLWAAWAEVE